jgi:hypothetical protein
MVSGDIICPFYTPDIIPNGWAQASSLFTNSQASFFYYWWITVQENCVLPNRVYFFSCLGNNGVGFGSAVSCDSYLSDFGNTFRGTPVAQDGRHLFYQQKFEIIDQNSNNMRISAGTSQKARMFATDYNKAYVGMTTTNRNPSLPCWMNLHYMKITTIGNTGNCSANNECPPGSYCNGTCKKCHGSCQFCTSGSASSCTRCSQFSTNWQVENNPAGNACTCKFF